MLDADDVVIAHLAEGAEEPLPQQAVVTVTNGPKRPRTRLDLLQRGRVEDAIATDSLGIEVDVLGVNVVRGIAKRAHGHDCVDALPEEMTRIEVGADFATHRFPKPEQGRGVVDDKAGVHFKAELANPVVASKRRLLLPIGDDHVLPLPVEDGQIVGGPRTGHPVRLL